jgi:long-chain acyl-CoA synthetase
MGLRSFAHEHPDKAAIIMAQSGETVSFGALSSRADQYANFFRNEGLQSGDSIAFTLENCAEFYALCSGALRAGLYYTAISTYLSVGETQYIVIDCGASLYISSACFRSSADELGRQLPKGVRRFSLGGDIPGYQGLMDEVSAMPASPLEDEVKGQDLLYSSGTTGQPKGIRIDLSGESPEFLSDNAKAIIDLYSFDAECIYLSPAPLYHAAPLRFNLWNLWSGGTSVIMERFSASAALEAVEKYRCTHSQWVPTMFVKMLKLDDAERLSFDVSSLRVAIHAAAPCAIEVKERMLEWWGPVIHEYYAGTEGSGFCAVNSEQWLAHRGTVGRPLIGAVHVVDAEGNELAMNQIGTVYFSGGTKFAYLNDPEKTAAAHNHKGWSTLGDVGYLDDDGYLYLTDRLAYTIISGGVNIYPQEAEDILVMHPMIADVAVFGVPDEEMGEQVKAVVQLLDHDTASAAIEQQLIEYCRARLSPIKCPKSVDFLDDLPRHATGKLYKRLLRDRYWRADANPP